MIQTHESAKKLITALARISDYAAQGRRYLFKGGNDPAQTAIRLAELLALCGAVADIAINAPEAAKGE